ncbi:NepR family anti-sigma factor [Pseudotabrizicola algicola]|uniref:Anti-sigma factor NepR domain-containing protein n=1 Tax=Pseudotabrizicola algicola TaxID=2709381 RepID=A0A6B3RK83_9RHOB|nr:NepR family anti-sigma factor [Pseudotabrizicola algicola]NEX46477.1 hypothetical protein [Pseudotabrizicola algicola]
MPDDDTQKARAAKGLPASNELQIKQLSRNLRRAFEADLDAPVPEHLQRLIDALQARLKDTGGPSRS